MRVLAIDPGSLGFGYAVSDSDESLDCYGFGDQLKQRYDKRCTFMVETLEEIWEQYRLCEKPIDEIAIEKPVQFRGRKIPALEVAYLSARNWAREKVRKQNVYTYHPATWRVGVAGSSRASKQYVGRVVCLHFPELPADVSDHTTDAIGILLYHFAQKRIRAMVQGGGK